MKKITKRILTTMLAVLMLIGAIPAVLSYADEATVPTKTYDFESDTVGEIPSYLTPDSNYKPDLTTIKVAEEGNGNKALYLNNTAGKPLFTIQFPTQTGKFTIGFRIKYMSEADNTQSLMSLNDGSNQTFTLLEQTGVLKNNNGASWVNLMDTYERNVWYTISAVIDVANKNFDITIQPDGGEAKTVTDFPFRKGATQISSFVIGTAGNKVAELYIDDIILPTDELPPVDPEPEIPDPTPDPEPEDPTPEDPADTTELQTAINKVASDLTAAQTALNTAITNGDKALDDKITALTGALDAAKKAYADADTAMKNSLSSKIEAADATLDTAIKAVQKNLDDAITALGAADKTNADAIANAITDLNTAIDAAEAAATAADTALKNEINTKIDAADEALQTAIDALTAELQSIKQALENKDKELDDKIKALENKNAEPTTDNETVDPIVIASIVISCVSVCGCVAIAALYVIDKKKKA